MGAPGGDPINAGGGGAQPKAVEELYMQLDSVRELYYNERASQMALSNLVREVVELRDLATVVARIKSLQVCRNARLLERQTGRQSDRQTDRQAGIRCTLAATLDVSAAAMLSSTAQVAAKPAAAAAAVLCEMLAPFCVQH
jgi:hypothetical protein